MAERILAHKLERHCLGAFGCVSRAWRAARAAVIHADLSGGREAAPIACSANCPLPPYFEYWTRSQGATEATRARLQQAAAEPCSCVGVCGGSCTCLQLQQSDIRCAYDESGRLRALLPGTADTAPIMECTPRCGCGPTCRNQVVGRGLRLRLEVFQATDGRGWGVRAAEAVQRGAFAFEYSGEYISQSETAQRRQRRPRTAAHYIMVVREHTRDGRVLRTIVDPTHRGNVGRFVNHSCEPNLSLQLVRCGSLVPCVALFAARDIAAGTELTMDYGASGDAGEDCGEKPCLCGAANCRGTLPFDASV